MICQDSIAHALRTISLVGATNEISDPSQKRLERVGVVVRVGTLQDGRDALEPGTRIDARCR